MFPIKYSMYTGRTANGTDRAEIWKHEKPGVFLHRTGSLSLPQKEQFMLSICSKRYCQATGLISLLTRM